MIISGVLRISKESPAKFAGLSFFDGLKIIGFPISFIFKNVVF